MLSPEGTTPITVTLESKRQTVLIKSFWFALIVKFCLLMKKQLWKDSLLSRDFNKGKKKKAIPDIQIFKTID